MATLQYSTATYKPIPNPTYKIARPAVIVKAPNNNFVLHLLMNYPHLVHELTNLTTHNIENGQVSIELQSAMDEEGVFFAVHTSSIPGYSFYTIESTFYGDEYFRSGYC